MAQRARASISLARVNDGDGGGSSLETITRYYILSDALPESTPLTEPSLWSLEEPYAIDEGAELSLYYCDVYESSDGTKTCSGVSLSNSFELIKEAISSAEQANMQIISESERTGALERDVNAIESDIVQLSNSSETMFNDVSRLKERPDYSGYIKITDEPSLLLGKQESGGSPVWATEITSDGINLTNRGEIAGQFINNDGKSVMKANNAILATLVFRSADGDGILGLVAQSNGHLSLKEV